MEDIQSITSLTLIPEVIWTVKFGFKLDTVFNAKRKQRIIDKVW
jgi:hypothetical protein